MENSKYPKITIAVSSTIGELNWLQMSLPLWLQQDYPALEIVVVNDGCPDITEELVHSIDSKIKYFKIGDKRQGYPFAKNASVKNASGEYIFLVDNDVLPLSKSYITNIYNQFNKLTDAAFLGGALYDKGSESTKYYGIYYSQYGINIHRKSISKESLVENQCPLRVGSYHGGAVFFKKNVWETLGGYDTMQPFMLDDTDLCARASIQGLNAYLYNKELLEHAGITNHANKEYFAWKFQFYYSAIATIMLKNYSVLNMYRFLLFNIAAPFIYFATAFKKKNILLVKAYFSSLFFFIKNLGIILKARKNIQSKRICGDNFLSIKSPY